MTTTPVWTEPQNATTRELRQAETSASAGERAVAQAELARREEQEQRVATLLGWRAR